MPFPVNVKINVKGSEQERPLPTIKTKIEVKRDGQEPAHTCRTGGGRKYGSPGLKPALTLLFYAALKRPCSTVLHAFGESRPSRNEGGPPARTCLDRGGSIGLGCEPISGPSHKAKVE